MPHPCSIVKMLRADLADAGIAYRDDDGRVVDFHALRHTFITNLARGGVYPKTAQQLARHSTITLTMDRYTHTVAGELSDGLRALPDPSGPTPERQRKTGTCDIAEETLTGWLTYFLTETACAENVVRFIAVRDGRE